MMHLGWYFGGIGWTKVNEQLMFEYNDGIGDSVQNQFIDGDGDEIQYWLETWKHVKTGKFRQYVRVDTWIKI